MRAPLPGMTVTEPAPPAPPAPPAAPADSDQLLGRVLAARASEGAARGARGGARIWVKQSSLPPAFPAIFDAANHRAARAPRRPRARPPLAGTD
ncbi:hypothetical protein JYU34_007876 [Plutella xylostella]|uniref:Uncharacterized protein n=1 Tax=Plutella xylostella TaxID=51655 RepID=A0ABQ7QRH7_PLUXY|nr:hypothetical protein JYU34_007876 [Plutella xylostella]